MNDIAIKVENLSKQYRLGQVGTGTISHDLNRWWHLVRGNEDPYLKIGETNDRTQKGESLYSWALKDINFEIKRGEILGVIGKNGAGKSTLLKILSKVTGPTTGSIKTKGRIASLLEVGTGFHPEMTGRENIYMNGTLMGMSRHEVSKKLDEIVDFAGVARYLDTPTKRYSSGMTVRLGFAIAAHLEPEILIVDEVLAVGDAEFQKKAIGKMQDVSQGEGRTVLFVSHNMGSISKLCNKGLLLVNGEVAFNGDIQQTIDKYYKQNQLLNVGKNIFNNDINNSKSNLNEVYVSKAQVINSNGENINSIKFREPFSIQMKWNVAELQNGIMIAIKISDRNNDAISIINTSESSIYFKEGKNNLILNIANNLFTPGEYSIQLGAFVKPNKNLNTYKDCLSFNILEEGHNSINNFNLTHTAKIILDATWEQ